jgi:hypothetical protein
MGNDFGLAVLFFLFFAMIGLFIVYWIIRIAVSHGINTSDLFDERYFIALRKILNPQPPVAPKPPAPIELLPAPEPVKAPELEPYKSIATTLNKYP